MNSINLILESAPLLVQGALMTIMLWIGCSIVALAIGTLLGIIRCKRLRIPIISRVCDIVTAVVRGVPFYVQLLIAYFVIPELCGFNLPPAIAAIMALGLCSAAYVSQSIRASINGIANGQWEAAQTLGYSSLQTIRYIIAPQMLRTIVPVLSAELDQLLKSTAIVSSIGVLELTRAGMNIVAREFTPVPVYCALALIYLAISTCLNISAYKVEQAVWYP